MKHLPKPTIVYQTERITVTRLAFREYMLHVDGELVSFHEEQFQAEHAAAMRLEEEMRDYMAGLAVWK